MRTHQKLMQTQCERIKKGCKSTFLYYANAMRTQCERTKKHANAMRTHNERTTSAYFLFIQTQTKTLEYTHYCCNR